MLVKDLINELQQFNQDASIDFIIEDNLEENHSIVDIEKTWFNSYDIEKKIIVAKKDATGVEIYLKLHDNIEIEYN